MQKFYKNPLFSFVLFLVCVTLFLVSGEYMYDLAPLQESYPNVTFTLEYRIVYFLNEALLVFAAVFGWETVLIVEAINKSLNANHISEDMKND